MFVLPMRLYCQPVIGVLCLLYETPALLYYAQQLIRSTNFQNSYQFSNKFPKVSA